jgi:hypothetical protein
LRSLPCIGEQPRRLVAGHSLQAVAPGPVPLTTTGPRRLVPFDLVGRCFNYLSTDHIAAVCPNAPRYLRCHGEDQESNVIGCGGSAAQATTVSLCCRAQPKVQQCCIGRAAWPSLRITRQWLVDHPGGSLAPTPDGSPPMHDTPSPPSPPLHLFRCAFGHGLT